MSRVRQSLRALRVNALIMHTATATAEQRAHLEHSPEQQQRRASDCESSQSEPLRDGKEQRSDRELLLRENEKSSHLPPLLRELEIDCGLGEDRELTAE